MRARTLTFFRRRAGKMPYKPGVLKGLKSITVQTTLLCMNTFLAIVNLSFPQFIIERLIGTIKPVTTLMFGKWTLNISARVFPPELLKLPLYNLTVISPQFLSLAMNFITLAMVETSTMSSQNFLQEFLLEFLMAFL